MHPVNAPASEAIPPISERARAVLADPRAKLLPAPARDLVQAMADEITQLQAQLAALSQSSPR